MLTGMTEDDWATVLQVFAASCSRRGSKSRNDRRFLETLHCCTVRNITWGVLPACFGNWISIWKRFWRLSRADMFEAFFEALDRSRGCFSTKIHLKTDWDGNPLAFAWPVARPATAHTLAFGAIGRDRRQMTHALEDDCIAAG